MRLAVTRPWYATELDRRRVQGGRSALQRAFRSTMVCSALSIGEKDTRRKSKNVALLLARSDRSNGCFCDHYRGWIGRQRSSTTAPGERTGCGDYQRRQAH